MIANQCLVGATRHTSIVWCRDGFLLIPSEKKFRLQISHMRDHAEKWFTPSYCCDSFLGHQNRWFDYYDSDFFLSTVYRLMIGFAIACMGFVVALLWRRCKQNERSLLYASWKRHVGLHHNNLRLHDIMEGGRSPEIFSTHCRFSHSSMQHTATIDP